MESLEDYQKKRDDTYRMAFWCLIRKFHINDFSSILDELALCCTINELSEEETKDILTETINSYVKQKGI